MKIKNFFASIINSLKKVFERFPLSLICIIFVTTLFTIFSETKFANSTIYMNILTFSLYFALGSFFTESIYNEDLQKRKPLYIIFGIVGIILTLLQNFKTFEITLIRIGLCYVSTLIIVSIYYLYKHSAISFETYILKIFSNFLKNSFIYGVLAIGIAIIYGIFTVVN